MSLCIIPDFDVFHSILKRDVSFPGVVECREAYNIAVYLSVKHGVNIILPKLIEDKIKKHINPRQEAHFYAVVQKDNSTSSDAGYDYSTCLARTAKTNSFRKRVIILTRQEIVAHSEIIHDNKKVIVLQPHNFITQYKHITNLPLKGDENFRDFLIFMFFFHNPRIDTSTVETELN